MANFPIEITRIGCSGKPRTDRWEPARFNKMPEAFQAKLTRLALQEVSRGESSNPDSVHAIVTGKKRGLYLWTIIGMEDEPVYSLVDRDHMEQTFTRFVRDYYYKDRVQKNAAAKAFYAILKAKEIARKEQQRLAAIQEQIAVERNRADYAAYDAYLAGLKLPKGKTQTFQFANDEGAELERTLMTYGDWGWRENESSRYEVTHIPSGRKLPLSVGTAAEARRTIAALLNNGCDYSQAVLDENALKALQQIHGYLWRIDGHNLGVPDYFKARISK